MPKKDFTQIALDVVRKATGEEPKRPEKPPKETAPKETKGAVQGKKAKATASK